ncbi:enoyl-CoA hydratase [Metabacillus arenae]|uniref:Enoyl-CoA hydratase/isomerase family protein n=1 Tax=Metabacillus arenae TaxID=2771434 RepID=A0A926RWL5_9BACI|nr:enoyl-CoA hydratase [Metabacillus arenae]MBD1380928.1 enoyl-CoA hydratase/isomerase family protein [Metabacillus arenae]
MSVKNTFEAGSVILDRFGAVAQLTLSRPSALNAMTWEMYQRLEEHLTALAADTTNRVLVIRGDGDKALAAGTDISQFRGFTGQDGLNYEKKIDLIMNKVASFPRPTIAAVNGYAVGGGMIISTVCDLRYATANAKFGAPMARTLGNCLSLDNYQRLAKELGSMRTKELLYTARLVSAEEAYSIGFLTAIFEEEDFFNKVLEIAAQISKNAPLTVDATKEALSRLNRNNGIIHSEQEFMDVISKVYGSKDFAEGVAAYIEKRSPVWLGE